MPIVPMLDDTAQVRFALKRTLLQQRQMLNIMAGKGVASARAGADSVSQTPSTSAGPDPDVSVVIPLYNHANWVGGAIRSAAACVGLQPEIVVVDDGSTDDSAQTVQSLMDANPTIAIRLVRHAENRGLAAARNTGFSHARSELVFLLDADNELFPQGLSRVVRTIRASDAGFAYGLLAAFGDESRLVSHLPWDVERLCRAPYIDAMALIRRSTWERIGGYSTGPGDVAYGWEDYQFWLGCAHAGISGQLTPELDRPVPGASRFDALRDERRHARDDALFPPRVPRVAVAGNQLTGVRMVMLSSVPDQSEELTQCLLDNSAMRGENAALRQALQVNVAAVNTLFGRVLELESEHPWLADGLRRSEQRCAELETQLVELGDEFESRPRVRAALRRVGDAARRRLGPTRRPLSDEDAPRRGPRASRVGRRAEGRRSEPVIATRADARRGGSPRGGVQA